MKRKIARFTKAEVRRAVEVAAEIGPDVAVDILPDGTIRLSRPTKGGAESPVEESRLVF